MARQTAKQAADKIGRVLTSMVQRQAAYAARQTANALAYTGALYEINANQPTGKPAGLSAGTLGAGRIAQVFDRPTRVTRQAAKYVGVPGKSLALRRYTSSIYIDDYSAKDKDATGGVGRAQQQTTGKAKIPPSYWLQYQIYGGPRSAKAIEKKLRSYGVLPPGMFVTPASATVLDAYGNIPGSFFQTIDAYFKQVPNYAGDSSPTSEKTKLARAGLRLAGRKVSKRDRLRPGYSKAATERRGGRRVFKEKTYLGAQFKSGQVFGRLVVGGKGRAKHLKPGIYVATGVGGAILKPILKFVRQPTYGRRFPFHTFVHSFVSLNAQKVFDELYVKAINDFAKRYINDPKPT